MAENACIDRYFPVTDIRMDNSGAVTADFRNDTEFPIIGYGLRYVVDMDWGQMTQEFHYFTIAWSKGTGETITHRAQLAFSDDVIAAIDPDRVSVNVVLVGQETGVDHSGGTPLEMFLKECEEI